MRAAMAFLTVIPVASDETGAGGAGAARLGRAYFPAVGALLGLLAGLGFALVAAVTSPLLAAVAAIGVMAVLTGALHLDGLADAADGLFGGGDTNELLQMRGAGLLLGPMLYLYEIDSLFPTFCG